MKTETKKRKLKLERDLEKCSNEILQFEEEIEVLGDKRAQTYEKIKDFTVDYYTAKNGKEFMEKINGEIKSLENKILVERRKSP